MQSHTKVEVSEAANYRRPDSSSKHEDWQVVSLAEVTLDSFGGGTPSTKNPDFWNGDIHWTTSAYLEGLYLRSGVRRITRKGLENSSSKLVPRDNLLVGTRVGVGKVAINTIDVAISQDLTALVLDKTKIDLEFAAYALVSDGPQSVFLSYTRGTTIKGVPRRDLLEIRIPLPPQDEQRRIARVLSTIQQAIKAQDKVIAAARELKRSLIRHLFTYGPVPVTETARVPLKDTEIGPVPEQWDVVPLKQVVERTKQTDPRKNPTSRFRYVDVSGISNEALTITGYADYEGKAAPSRARKLIKSGDTIFATVRPYLRRIARVPPELDGQICSTAFCVIRWKRDVAEPEFVFQAVTTDSFVARVTGHQRGSSYPAVTDKQVLGELIPLPPLAEQGQIARSLRALDDRIKAEEKRKAALQALFKSMLHHLMTGKIRVKDLEI